MVTEKRINSTLFLALGIILFCVLPAAAINCAIYGNTAGFNPNLHQDTFTVIYSLPGTVGSDLDANVTQYTNASTDVVFIGGNATFSTVTASQIENAVSSGKVLVVTENNFQNFATSIPVQKTGTAPVGMYLNVANPNTSISQDVFAGLGSHFPNTTPVSGREQYASKSGAVTLLDFDNDDPGLVYTKYGNGFIIAWTLTSPEDYLSGVQADTINERLITHLLVLRSPSIPTTGVTTAAPTTITDTGVPSNVTGTMVTSGTSMAEQAYGLVSVYSSPLGANVFIDGEYQGITPLNRTSIAAGSHSLKMAMDGYYDYDSTIYIISGGTITAFGTLPPRGNTAVVATVVPTVTVAVTATQASIFESPAVVAAILGILTAFIGATVTIFTIYHKNKGT